MTERRRIDQWLWYARIVKTRTLAQKLVNEGRVRVNGVKIAKPAHEVAPGETVTVAHGGDVKVLAVRAAGARRGPALEARALYELVSGRPVAAAPAKPYQDGA